ncbi:NAD(P)/FAD-dependent oxidoreductase [Actinoplanes sp. NPDC049596]|uniref:FAD-dependent oxidoreductase n=1 Tax=unclassified Actinoplanes TaxID=2626549 RepID=UPI00344A7775
MDRARTAIVVGGGIAGPVAAIALRKAGIEATVYEAYEGTAEGIGGALTLAPNGIAALDAIGIGEAVTAAGSETPRMVMETGSGRRLGVFTDLPGLPVSRTFARPELYAALRKVAEDAGVSTRHGKRLVSYADGPGGVTAAFADGSSATADVLIGADGIHSAVRRLLDPAAPAPRYVGLLGLGGWVPDDGLPSTAGAMHFAFGKRGFFGYWVFGGRAGWFANLASEKPLSAAEARAVPEGEWLRRLRELFAGEKLPAFRMLDRVEPGTLVNVGGMYELPPVPVWRRGRVVLTGDAAHATSPSSGQGASLAVESAIELARCLRDLPVPAALAAYESLRRARVERVIAQTAKVNTAKAAGPVARVVRDLTFPLAMRTVFSQERMMGWMHRYKVDWNSMVIQTE